jgi:hypothetical protein
MTEYPPETPLIRWMGRRFQCDQCYTSAIIPSREWAEMDARNEARYEAQYGKKGER